MDRPRLLASAALALIAVASLVALAWPALPFQSQPATQRVGVITRIAPGTAEVGAPLPELEWAGGDGAIHRLSELRGRTVLLNFWATWCEPCREEMPALDRAARQDPTIAVVAVDLDEPAAKVDSFLERLALEHLTAVLDPGARLTRQFAVLGLPSTLFVAPDGTLRHVEVRAMDDALIRANVARAR